MFTFEGTPTRKSGGKALMMRRRFHQPFLERANTIGSDMQTRQPDDDDEDEEVRTRKLNIGNCYINRFVI